MSLLRGKISAWRDWRRFNTLPAEERAIVFYAEDASSWAHFEDMVRALTGPLGRRLCYLTSQDDDPILGAAPSGVRPFFIGDGLLRTITFQGLRAGVMVMTMPDLQTFHVKRSRICPVHYVYTFHALASTHMVYRPAAFDHFDTILCVGPHHLAEIRATESACGLPPKALVECGYARLDRCLQRAAACRQAPDPRRVLLAPSWGRHELLLDHGRKLCDVLLGAGLEVVVRPHPMTMRHHAARIRELAAACGQNPRFTLETDVTSTESLETSGLMISDWSGAALEYALAFERPVVFIETPRKVHNPGYELLGIEPLEIALRHEIGEVLHPDELKRLPDVIQRLTTDGPQHRERLRALRARAAFNLGRSGAVAAETIAGIADRLAGADASRCRGAGSAVAS